MKKKYYATAIQLVAFAVLAGSATADVITTNSAINDAALLSGTLTHYNYGQTDFLTAGGEGYRQSVMAFDVSGVSVGAGESISSATLTFTVRDEHAINDSFAVSLYQIADANDGWVEGSQTGAYNVSEVGATYGFKTGPYATETDWAGGEATGCTVSGTDHIATALDTQTVGHLGAGSKVTFTIDTDLVQQWVDGGINAGIVMKGDGTADHTWFYSDEATTASYRPELVVTVVPEPATIGLFIISGAGVLILRRAQHL